MIKSGCLRHPDLMFRKFKVANVQGFQTIQSLRCFTEFTLNVVNVFRRRLES